MILPNLELHVNKNNASVTDWGQINHRDTETRRFHGDSFLQKKPRKPPLSSVREII